MRKEKRNLKPRTSLTAQTLADRSGVSAETVRYYTRRGLLNPVRNPRNRYNLYKKLDIARLRFIRQAKNLGYTLNEIAKIFEQAKHGDSPCPLARKIIAYRINDNRKRMDEMLELQKRMETALAVWAKLPDKVPTGNSVCHLIESTPES